MAEESLKEKTAKGLFWGGLNNALQQVVGLVFGIVLGRLLVPADYGMMAMISIFSLIAIALQNSGFITALTNLDHPTDEDYNSVFWFNISVGVLAYVVLFFSAPLIASYYHDARLIPLCRYSFLSIIIASFATSQNAWLFKNLKAKQQAKANVTATILSSTIGVSCAFGGMAYWSLATQSLSYVLINTLLVWHYSRWRPSIHGISMRPARRMFRFSCKVLASSIITIVNNNVLNLLLGHYFSAHDTGNYNQAYQWNFKCFNLVQNMVVQVAQPVLVQLRSDSGRQLQALRKMVRFAAFIAFPLLLGFGLVAREFIIIALTEKWIVSAEFIQILCLSGATIPLVTVLSNVLLSKGRSGLYFWCTAIQGALLIGIMVLIWPWGIRAMVIAYTVLNILWLFVWHACAWRLTGYNVLLFLRDIVPFALAAGGVMTAVHFLTLPIGNLWLLLISRIVLAVVFYYGVMKIARVQILKECEGFIKRKRE